MAENRPKVKGLTLPFWSILGTFWEGLKTARNHFKVKAVDFTQTAQDVGVKYARKQNMV